MGHQHDETHTTEARVALRAITVTIFIRIAMMNKQQRHTIQAANVVWSFSDDASNQPPEQTTWCIYRFHKTIAGSEAGEPAASRDSQDWILVS